MRLYALGQDDKRREVELEEFWPHKGSLVLKLKGVDSMNDAETFLRCELQVPAAERALLEPGEAYISDLVGCEVIDVGRTIGIVSTLQFGAGEAPLLVVRDGNRNTFSPLAEAFLAAPADGIAITLRTRRSTCVLPEGLLDVNAPLPTKQHDKKKVARSDFLVSQRILVKWF